MHMKAVTDIHTVLHHNTTITMWCMCMHMSTYTHVYTQITSTNTNTKQVLYNLTLKVHYCIEDWTDKNMELAQNVAAVESTKFSLLA